VERIITNTPNFVNIIRGDLVSSQGQVKGNRK